jgi:PAS domain S-box-containing protein
MQERAELSNPSSLLRPPDRSSDLRTEARRHVHLVCELTSDLDFAYVSPGFERDLGYSVEELLGTRFQDYIHSEDRARLDELFESNLVSGREFSATARIRGRQGEWHRCSWRVHTYVGRAKATRIGIWGVDVHDQQIHETIFGELIEKARDAQVVFDPVGRIQLFNAGAEELLGYASSEVLNQTFQIFMPERFRPHRGHLWMNFILEGENHRRAAPTEVIALRKDGSEVALSVLVSRVGDGAVPYVIACLRDIEGEAAAAERRKLLAAQRTQAKRYEILGKIANGIAHDSNNLLGAIANLSNLALDSIEADSPARPFIVDVKRATFRIAELCRRLMTFTGKSDSEPGPVDLSAEIAAMRRLLEASVAKTTELRFELAPGLKAIDADPAQLHQLLLNLVVNAAESLGGKSGTVVIRTGVTSSSDIDLEDSQVVDGLPEGPCGFLEVSDDGCGIDEHARGRLFEPFFSTKTESGRGFGMAVVLDIVRAHAGSLQIKSKPGEGTAISVFFPLSERLAVKRLRNPGRRSPAFRAGRGTILLVDDEDVLRTSTKGILEAVGYTVAIATNGAEAVVAFESAPLRFDLVILDLAMPGMNGWQAHQEIQAIRPGVKVLFVSGWPEEVARSRATGSSPSGFVQKPYEAATLLQIVEDVIDPRASASPAGPPGI